MGPWLLLELVWAELRSRECHVMLCICELPSTSNHLWQNGATKRFPIRRPHPAQPIPRAVGERHDHPRKRGRGSPHRVLTEQQLKLVVHARYREQRTAHARDSPAPESQPCVHALRWHIPRDAD